MCGIAGFLGRTGQKGAMEEILRRMGQTLAHRGPDSQGRWFDEQGGFGVVHRRLSIIDLSVEGSQPMHSPGGRYVVAYNGEIYNFRELRGTLESLGYGFRGHSDTEVMLTAIEHWGMEAALDRFVGMFAFALWDTKEKVLYLVRDRFGEKPLYYGWTGKVFLFGSELKALRAHPLWPGGIDRQALSLYMRFSYVPAPFSINPDIRKVMPGTYLKVSFANGNCRLSEHTYWSLRDAAANAARSPFQADEVDLIDMLDEMLKAIIREKMIVDVPLGAFLSGGIDSSMVVSIMQAVNDRPVKTFTIGFNERGYNESVQAKSIAEHLGTEHTEMIACPAEAMAVIPELATIYDEPFADSSQIPTLMVSRLARKSVKVSLSGDGGDEVFGGYNRYLNAGRFAAMLKQPLFLRKMAEKGIEALSPRRWDGLVRFFSCCSPGELVDSKAGDKLHKFAGILTAADEAEIFNRLVSTWQDPQEALSGSTAGNRWNILENFPERSFIERMMISDTRNYLPDDILVKLDRASMATSLEARVPFLDHRLFEFAWRIPTAAKVGEGRGKLIIRKLLNRYVPQQIMDRPKKGFAVPIGEWLRAELRDWVENQLDEKRLQEEGYLHAGHIRQKWAEHLSGSRNWQHQLWNVLMFQSWLESNCK